MDLTYLVAGFISLLVGLAAAILLVLLRRRFSGKFIATAIGVAVTLDLVLLLDWQRADEMSVEFLLLDLAFFAFYGLIGCVIGVLPILALRRFWNSARQKDN